MVAIEAAMLAGQPDSDLCCLRDPTLTTQSGVLASARLDCGSGLLQPPQGPPQTIQCVGRRLLSDSRGKRVARRRPIAGGKR